MQQLTYYVATTVDGFIANSDGSFEFFLQSGDHADDYLTRLKEFDFALMGRKTYEVGLAMGVTNPYPHLETFVVSTTLPADPDGVVEMIRSDVVQSVRTLKARPGRGIYLCGGGELAGTLLSAGLIDVVEVKINPVAAHSGVPLFASASSVTHFTVDAVKRYDSGVVAIRYAVDSVLKNQSRQ